MTASSSKHTRCVHYICIDVCTVVCVQCARQSHGSVRQCMRQCVVVCSSASCSVWQCTRHGSALGSSEWQCAAVCGYRAAVCSYCATGRRVRQRKRQCVAVRQCVCESPAVRARGSVCLSSSGAAVMCGSAANRRSVL
jgi:hypothetical protein